MFNQLKNLDQVRDVQEIRRRNLKNRGISLKQMAINGDLKNRKVIIVLLVK